jgi:hypothetical protein
VITARGKPRRPGRWRSHFLDCGWISVVSLLPKGFPPHQYTLRPPRHEPQAGSLLSREPVSFKRAPAKGSINLWLNQGILQMG